MSKVIVIGDRQVGQTNILQSLAQIYDRRWE